jgi:hypothetical protein
MEEWVMRRPANCAVLWLIAASLASAADPPTFIVQRPTIVAFFSPVNPSERAKPDLNEALSDFQFYASQVRAPLEKLGMDFHEVYTRSFRISIAGKVSTFRTGKAAVGYYFIAPGKKPRIERGVDTDIGILQVAHDYFRGLAR